MTPVTTAAAILMEVKGLTQDAMRAQNRCLMYTSQVVVYYSRPYTRHFPSFRFFYEYALPLSLGIEIFKSTVFFFFFQSGEKKRRVYQVVGSRDVDWYNRSIIDENNKVEWTSNMAGSSPQVLKQAFHETYELKEELGK